MKVSFNTDLNTTKTYELDFYEQMGKKFQLFEISAKSSENKKNSILLYSEIIDKKEYQYNRINSSEYYYFIETFINNFDNNKKLLYNNDETQIYYQLYMNSKKIINIYIELITKNGVVFTKSKQIKVKNIYNLPELYNLEYDSKMFIIKNIRKISEKYEIY